MHSPYIYSIFVGAYLPVHVVRPGVVTKLAQRCRLSIVCICENVCEEGADVGEHECRRRMQQPVALCLDWPADSSHQ
jgi:hypothetical protein